MDELLALRGQRKYQMILDEDSKMNDLDITELQFLEHDLNKLYIDNTNLTNDDFTILIRAILVLVQDKLRDVSTKSCLSPIKESTL